MPNATQVARPFLADGADEGDRADGLHVRGADRARHREHHGEPTAIVADSRAEESCPLTFHANDGAFGKDRVEMSRDHHVRSTPRAPPLGDDVSLGVDARVAEPERGEATPKLLRASRFLERRRRDLADRNLLVERPRVARANRVERGADARVARRHVETLRPERGSDQAEGRENEQGP